MKSLVYFCSFFSSSQEDKKYINKQIKNNETFLLFYFQNFFVSIFIKPLQKKKLQLNKTLIDNYKNFELVCPNDSSLLIHMFILWYMILRKFIFKIL